MARGVRAAPRADSDVPPFRRFRVLARQAVMGEEDERRLFPPIVALELWAHAMTVIDGCLVIQRYELEEPEPFEKRRPYLVAVPWRIFAAGNWADAWELEG